MRKSKEENRKSVMMNYSRGNHPGPTRNGSRGYGLAMMPSHVNVNTYILENHDIYFSDAIDWVAVGCEHICTLSLQKTKHTDHD